MMNNTGLALGSVNSVYRFMVVRVSGGRTNTNLYASCKTYAGAKEVLDDAVAMYEDDGGKTSIYILELRGIYVEPEVRPGLTEFPRED